MSEEVILINDIPHYKIPNGTSYRYAPIPKEFKPYFEGLQQENQQLKSDLLKEEISYNNLRESYNLEYDRNKKLVSRIENDEEDIRHLLDIINHNCNELKCNSDEWLVLKGWQDRLKEGNNE